MAGQCISGWVHMCDVTHTCACCSMLQCYEVCCSEDRAGFCLASSVSSSTTATATHCNTLQHTAAHCNVHTDETNSNPAPPSRTATHCNTLQHSTTHVQMSHVTRMNLPPLICTSHFHRHCNKLQHTLQHTYG